MVLNKFQRLGMTELMIIFKNLDLLSPSENTYVKMSGDLIIVFVCVTSLYQALMKN